MLINIKTVQRMLTCSLLASLAGGTLQAQVPNPTWWMGAAGGANFNFYNGTTQKLTNTLTVPTAFQKGFGVGSFGAVQLEYRPAGSLGLMLNVGYDDRSAKFDDVMALPNAPASLKTDLTYLTVEPSLRFGPTTSHIFFFAGPRLAFNMGKDFTYTQQNRPTTEAELSQVRKTVFSGQVGMGVEYGITDRNSYIQVRIAPFLSYHPIFGQAPRDI